MSLQLIFTSVPGGLEAGKYGYCTVARHRELPARLIRLLEGWSYLQEHGPASPPVHVYRRVDVGGKTWAVLTRIADAGTDYSGRSNFIAHHLILTQTETAQAPSPALILRDGKGWLDRWEGPARYLDADTRFSWPGEDESPGEAWASATGKADYLHHLLALPNGEVARLARPAGETSHAVLTLFAEAMAHAPDRGWSFPFTARWQKGDQREDFRWIAGPEDRLRQLTRVAATADFDWSSDPPRFPSLQEGRLHPDHRPSGLPEHSLPSRTPDPVRPSPVTGPRPTRRSSSRPRIPPPVRSSPNRWVPVTLLGFGAILIAAFILLAWRGTSVPSLPPEPAPDPLTLTHEAPAPPSVLAPVDPLPEPPPPPPTTAETDPPPAPDPVAKARRHLHDFVRAHALREPQQPLPANFASLWATMDGFWRQLPEAEQRELWQNWGFAPRNHLVSLPAGDGLNDLVVSGNDWSGLEEKMATTAVFWLGVAGSAGPREWVPLQAGEATSFRRFFVGGPHQLSYVRQDDALYLNAPLSRRLREGQVLLLLFPALPEPLMVHLIPQRRTEPYLYADPVFLQLDGPVLRINNWPEEFIAMEKTAMRLRSTFDGNLEGTGAPDETPPPFVRNFFQQITHPAAAVTTLAALQTPLPRERGGPTDPVREAEQEQMLARRLTLAQALSAYRPELETHVRENLARQRASRDDWDAATAEQRARMGSRPSVDSFSSLRNTLQAESLQRFQVSLAGPHDLLDLALRHWPGPGTTLDRQEEEQLLGALRREAGSGHGLHDNRAMAFALLLRMAREGFNLGGNIPSQTVWEGISVGRERWQREIERELSALRERRAEGRWSAFLQKLTGDGQIPFGPWEIDLGEHPLIRF